MRDLFADEHTRQAGFILVAIIALVFMMSSMRRWQRRAQTPRRDPIPPPRSVSQGTALRRDLDDLMVELQDLSRKISAEIDTRFAKLEAAMRDADRRIAVLNRLARGQQECGARTAESPGAAPAAGLEPGNRHQVVYELADAGFNPVEIARDLDARRGRWNSF